MDEELGEKVLSKAARFEGSIIQVAHWQTRLPNGKTALREIVVHPGGAAVVPVDARGRVAMVRQGRPAVGGVLLEIPAGKLEGAGEDPLAAAQRELREETGLIAQVWHPLMVMLPTPGYCNERISIFLATDLAQHEAQPDEDEFVRVEWMPLEEAVACVMRGEICDAKTAVGLLMAHQRFGQPCLPSLELPTI